MMILCGFNNIADEAKAEAFRVFNSTQSDAEPGITRFPYESYRKYIRGLRGKVIYKEK